MQHEFPGKQDYRRFRFNQNVWFEFSATSSSEWNSIFQISKKEENLASYTIRGIGLLYEVYFFPESFLSIQLCSWSFSVEWFAFRKFNISRNFSGKFLYHLTLFPNFRKFWLNGKRPRKHYVSFSAARYCFRNIDLARQVSHKFYVQPRIMSNVPVCLLICHENKATLFTRKLEQQYFLTSEMKNFIAPWQIMAR